MRLLHLLDKGKTADPGRFEYLVIYSVGVNPLLALLAEWLHGVGRRECLKRFSSDLLILPNSFSE